MESPELEIKPPGKNWNFLKVNVILFIAASCIYFIYDLAMGDRIKSRDSVEKILITGHKKLSKEEIIHLLDLKQGLSIKDYNLDEIEERVKEHPRIKDARLVQRSGTRLLLSIIERDARFIVNTGDNLYEIDEDFNIISSNFVVDTSVIILSGDFSFNPKNNKDTKFRDFAETVWENFGQFPVLMDRISEVVLGSDGEISIFIYRPMRMKVLMGDTLNRKQVRKLYSSLAYFEKKKNKVGLLDLRGDDAVYY